MKYILMCLIAALMVGCSPSVSDLQNNVKDSFAHKINSDDQLSKLGMTVQSVTLTHSDGNNYQGIVTVLYKGQQEDVPVHVVYDGKNMVWDTPPGSFAFAFRDIMQNAMQKSSENYANYMKHAAYCNKYLESGSASKYQDCINSMAQSYLGDAQ